MITTSSLPQVAPQYDLQELYDVGLHYGHQVRKWYPRMKPWIYMEKNGVHIFDLAKTAAQLQTAYNFAYQLGLDGKNLVIVCTKRQAREMIAAAAKEAGCSQITARWLGGLFTNWEQVYKSLQRMIKTREQLAVGAFKGRTKYEIVQIEKDVTRLERFFGGIETLKKLPDALLVIDPVREHNAVAEAASVGVPIMALIDSDGNPDQIDIPIPGNDDAIKSITYVVTQITAGYAAGKQTREGKKVTVTPSANQQAPITLPAEKESTVVMKPQAGKVAAVTEAASDVTSDKTKVSSASVKKAEKPKKSTVAKKTTKTMAASDKKPVEKKEKPSKAQAAAKPAAKKLPAKTAVTTKSKSVAKSK